MSTTPGGTASDGIGRVVLIRSASVTHHFDNDQRYIELPFTSTGTFPASVQLTITAPTANLAPPGYYMLFVVASDSEDILPGSPPGGVPSVATFITIN